jgi:hypothetical protein
VKRVDKNGKEFIYDPNGLVKARKRKLKRIKPKKIKPIKIKKVKTDKIYYPEGTELSVLAKYVVEEFKEIQRQKQCQKDNFMTCEEFFNRKREKNIKNNNYTKDSELW